MCPMIKIHGRFSRWTIRAGSVPLGGKNSNKLAALCLGYAHDQLGGVLDLGKRFLEQTRGNSPPLQRFG
jgi:hypothetical protein